MKVYLAGPMTGMPKNNFPNFRRAADRLRERGYDVVSPHELDSEIEQRQAWEAEGGIDDPVLWAKCLARDVYLLSSDGIEAVVVLPHWHCSRGAALETFVAYRLCGMPVYSYSYGSTLEPVSALTLDRAHLELRR